MIFALIIAFSVDDNLHNFAGIELIDLGKRLK